MTRTALPTVDASDRIGPYRILDKLGEGGMGEVYRAEQEEPIRRKVALKLIKAGMDTKQVVARFESERQALALMSHPNIAKVFEAGATEQGRPYFVMEYVQGVPITEYCDKHRLRTNERLELFMQVCAGLQHAHQKGIIHRDIKPSNVLVGFEDGKPVPKIIDFGVAKATEQRLTEKSLFTQMGVLIGTPEYMSPEQAEMTALDIDTRTDVYSLGVMLYELLVGALPFAPKELRRVAFDEICRKIREEEPSKPSARVSTLGGAFAESARRRKTDPSSLTRELRGDLDWITMKALEKDRTRRYPSPSEFAADIKRHLQHEPVVAGRPSAGYRAKKFIRRHRVGVGFAALLVIVLAGSTGLLAIQAARIAQERDRANEEAATAEQVSDFLVDLFEVSDPGEARGNAITAREILDTGAAKIEAELQDRPRVRARLVFTIGRVYLSLGLHSEAEPLLEEALGTQRELFGESHPDTLETMSHLAWLQAFDGRHEQAEVLNLERLEAARRGLGERHPSTLGAMNALGNTYRLQSRYDEAEPLLLAALAGQRQVIGDDHRDTRMSMINLGLLYGELGRYRDVEPLFRAVLEIEGRLLGVDHPDTLVTMGRLANLYRAQGRYDEAERLFLETLEIQRRILGEDHSRTRGTELNLSFLYLDTGRYDDAEKAMVRGLVAERRLSGDDHPDIFVKMWGLAELYLEQGRLDEAEEHCLEALSGLRRVLGEDHSYTLASLHTLARIRAEQGQTESALDLLRHAIERGYTAWGSPAYILKQWRSYDGDPEYEAIVAGLRKELEAG
jgi:non-specific serine/threonine protein kinase/serine/threonine-protein kinase